MNKSLKLYFQLFISTFFLSASTFGGGYVIVPLMRKKFVEQYKWIEEKEMLDLVAISQSSPGAIAINASILVGYRIMGIRGVILTVLGTVLPPLIIISVISLFYVEFKQNTVINIILKGMNAGVAAVIADVIIEMTKSIIKEKSVFSSFVMFFSFILVFFFNIDIKIIILAGGILGLMNTFYYRRIKGR